VNKSMINERTVETNTKNLVLHQIINHCYTFFLFFFYSRYWNNHNAWGLFIDVSTTLVTVVCLMFTMLL